MACTFRRRFVHFDVQNAQAQDRPATLADALRFALPPGTRVVTGGHSLDRTVSWARAATSRPWAIGSLENNALVILSLRGLTTRSEIQSLSRLTEALVSANAAGLAVSEETPELIEALGPQDGFPILTLPADVALPDIERAVIQLIVDRDGQVQRRALETYQSLINLALNDAPAQVMVTTLAEAAGRVAYLENEYGILQAVAAPSQREALELPTVDEAASLYSAREVLGISVGAPASGEHLNRCIRRVLRDGAYAVCSSPIAIGGTVAGFLTLLGGASDVEEIDEELLTRAAPAFAVPVAKHRAVMETQTRLQGGFLENLLGGTFADEDEIAARAQYLGHNLREPYDIACLMLDDPADRRAAADEAQRIGLWTSFLDLAHREIVAKWPRALIRERGDVIAVLILVADEEPELQFSQELEALRGRVDALVSATTTTIGLGRRANSPRAIVSSYAEAEQAARIGRQFLGGHQTIAFDDLGVYRIIARVEDRDALTTFRSEYLGPLEEYDRRHSAELVETLEGFFHCNGNHARAAEMLHLHRNTLLYRLERIEALTGRDLSDAETRLSMQLALKIRRVADTLRSNPTRSYGGNRQ
jgi:PucR family transcriptional regulator, purine catabolism regulatory protein